jgi:hypothetical protein
MHAGSFIAGSMMEGFVEFFTSFKERGGEE